MEWQIRFIEVIVYSSIYGSAALLLLLLIRKIAGKKINPGERMLLWWAVILAFILTMTIFPKGNFTTMYVNRGYGFPPIYMNFDIFGELKDDNIFVKTGDIQVTVTAFIKGSWKILWSGNGNLLLNITFILYLTGLIFTILFYLITFIQLNRKLKSYLSSEDEKITQYIQHDALFYGIRPPSIILVPQKFFKKIICPCVVGYFSPALMIVSEQWEKLSMEQRQAVITHEIYHIKRKDNFLNLFLILIQALQWFNPVVWFGFKYLRQDLECLRDTQIIQYLTGKEKIQYAKAIVAIAAMSKKKYTAAMHSGMLCSSGIGYRIWLLQNHDKRWNRWGIILILLFVGLLIYAISNKETFGLFTSRYVS